MTIYDIYFSICLGLFIGGILMSIVSIILAELSTHDQDAHDHVDHVDHIDHLDHLDHIDHIDYADFLDQADHLDYIDHLDHMDHLDKLDHAEDISDSSLNDATPAPFMLLFSTGLLFFGISGITSYYAFLNSLGVIMFLIPPIVAFIVNRSISTTWKKIAKSRFYAIASTQNLIGMECEVVLNVDERGGVIKIPSNTPMKFERHHAKPLHPNRRFEAKERVFICDVDRGFMLVDSEINRIRSRRSRQ